MSRSLPSPAPRPSVAALGVKSLWIVFWTWTAVTAVLWFTGAGDYEVGQFVRYLSGSHEVGVGEKTSLQRTLETLLNWVDPVWLILATLVAHSSTAREQGLATARRWTGSIFGAVFLVATLNGLARVPFGPVLWTDRLGPRLGSVPLGLPLMWCVVILGSRQFLRHFLARASHLQVSVLTALCAAGFALELEPVAQKARVFWLWESKGPSFWYYLAWAVLAGGLAYSFRSETPLGSKKPELGAFGAFLALSGLVIAAQAGRLLHS